MSCGSSFLYIKKKVGGKHLFAFVPSRCKSWSCPVCRPIKANIVRNYILDNFETNNLFMITLTFFHSGTVESCWEQLGPRWNRMRTYIAKKYGKFSYIRIVEPHKSGGWPHMHILVKGHVMKLDVVKSITGWGFGWNMDCVRIPYKTAAKYVSKYLTKEWPSTGANVLRIASKCRIVSVSRGMPAIFTAKSEWECVRYSMPSDNAVFMCNAIIKLLRDRNCTYVTSRPFSEGFVVESDIDLPNDWLESFVEPYIFRVCDEFDYSYLPYGIQQEILLGNL